MEWYHILLIVVAALVVVALLIFSILYITSKKSKEKSLGEAKGLYNKIVETFGGVDNISNLSVNGSRLSITLKDSSYINNETLQIMTDNGFGVVKTSKKITLVVGEMANHYYQEINKLLSK